MLYGKEEETMTASRMWQITRMAALTGLAYVGILRLMGDPLPYRVTLMSAAGVAVALGVFDWFKGGKQAAHL